MYGVESVVHPDYRGYGVGSKLMDARFETLKALNLRGMVAGSLFIDYHRHADRYTPEEYVRAVIAGEVFDTNLTKQLAKGFRVVNLIPNYIEEPRTRDYGAAIVWENPDYRPGKAVARTAPAARSQVRLHQRRAPVPPLRPLYPSTGIGSAPPLGSAAGS